MLRETLFRAITVGVKTIIQGREMRLTSEYSWEFTASEQR